MEFNQKKLNELYCYHAPKRTKSDQKRLNRYQAINRAIALCAEKLLDNIDTPSNAVKVLEALQNVRMLANQAITFESIGLDYWEVIAPKSRDQVSDPD